MYAMGCKISYNKSCKTIKIVNPEDEVKILTSSYFIFWVFEIKYLFKKGKKVKDK